jgi:hypothetical protein
MRIFHILRAHPRMSLAAALLLALPLIFWLLGWGQQVPHYPDAHNLRYETPLFNGGWFRDCGHNGEGREAHTRITGFETSATPEAVLQFYHAALVEQGSYMVIYHEYKGMLGYGFNRRFVDNGERAIFESDTPLDLTKPFYNIGGSGVVVDAAPEAGQTTVQIIEYKYERTFGRACHP